jgi:hypothetical protein
MAEHIAGSAKNATVLVINNSESSEVMCMCCDKLKIELKKALIELKSTQKLLNCYMKK